MIKLWFNKFSIEARVYMLAMITMWVFSTLVLLVPMEATCWAVAGILNTLGLAFAVLFVWHYLIGSSSFLHHVYDWTYRITGITRFKNLVEVYRSKDHGVKKS